MERYSVITEKNPREIVLLRGHGCEWRKCTFCDYHFDCSSNDEENLAINKEALSHVTGQFGKLEVINSGSFAELDGNTMNEIVVTCMNTGISEIHFESHWMFKDETKSVKDLFGALGIVTKFKIGVETFDYDMREKVLVKGIPVKNPMHIADYFDEVCLLQGIKGQTAQSMINDIEKGLECFERVCVNVMCENSTEIKPDPAVIEQFKQFVLPKYQDNNRVDILLNNTDFGVGE